jgi:nicotinate-nucleotide adenylyltransferase
MRGTPGEHPAMSAARFFRALPPAGTRQRLGLFGGSFDPVHSGHLHLARTALKQLQLDAVWWFPARGNPLKEAASAYTQRLEGVRNAVRGDRAMRVSPLEAEAGLTYSLDLIRLVKAHCRQAQLVWLMGSDNLASFHHWKAWREIAETVPIAVIARPGSLVSARNAPFARLYRDRRLPRHLAARLPQAPPPAWTWLSAPLDPVSSTALRAAQASS